MFWEGDVAQAIDLLRFIESLGGCKAHNALLVADAATPFKQCAEAKKIASRCFAEVRCIANPESTNGWPQGPNSLFHAAAKYIEAAWTQPWINLETDAIPLRPGWLDKLEVEYREHKALFMGDVYNGLHSSTGMPIRALSGVCVYPPDAGTLLKHDPAVPWDMLNREMMLERSHATQLIKHLYGERNLAPTFVESKGNGAPRNAFTLDELRQSAVLFHRNKDGTLLRLLRKKMGFIERLTDPPCFICLGRYGDLMIVLPALKLIRDKMGINPRLIVSREYMPILDGVSYVESIPIKDHWWQGIPNARRLAQQQYGGGTVLQCHGNDWGVDMSKWPNFQTSMWDRTGVPLDLMLKTPLVFDRRNSARETQLVRQQSYKDRRLFLYNFAGVSSPFAYKKEVMRVIQDFRDHFHMVDLSAIKATRIYDLLGLYDNAAGLITIDTATAHLANGSGVPTIWLTVGGWNTSVPRGNPILQLNYAEVPSQLQKIREAMESLTKP